VSIEAARAGEAGKGFAVVANEVKELAKQSAAATEDISHKVEAIQGGTKGAVDAIGSISSIINQINEIAGTIATAVELQNSTTGEISRNLAEAARVSETITQNISGVAEAAHSTSRGVTDSQKTVEELAKMSSELHELVGQFKY
jgi:methyl-accepting chemotaxis protein